MIITHCETSQKQGVLNPLLTLNVCLCFISQCTNVAEMVSGTNKEVQECEDQRHVNLLAKWAWFLCHH